jgi:hypothetical protein
VDDGERAEEKWREQFFLQLCSDARSNNRDVVVENANRVFFFTNLAEPAQETSRANEESTTDEGARGELGELSLIDQNKSS